MSAQPVEQPIEQPIEPPEDPSGAAQAEDPGQAAAEPAPAQSFEVRRNPLVVGGIGAAAAAMGTAYLRRALESGALLDWVLCLLLGAMAVVFLRSLLDSRTPLLVGDERGVRIRLGTQWRGFPWDAIDRVEVTPRRGLLRDGRLLISLHDPRRSVEGLEGRAMRHARLNSWVYGGPLAVPLGPTTRLSPLDDLGQHAAALARGRAEVVSLLATPGPVVKAEDARTDGLPVTGPPDERRVIEADTVVEADRRPRWLRRDEGGGRPTAAEGPPADTRVRPIARLAEPVEPPVIGEFAPEPAYDPVIGPELAGARTRVGLTVDELADRTRIRPHVIESIEVDDFSPCGGDFYARGHIRTLARVLGKDAAPMLAHFDARYASAPVTARRVFEAELATGLTGTIRGTGAAGANWMLLIGAVLVLVLVWSGVRLFAGAGDATLEAPPPVLNGSAGLGSGFGQPTTAAGPEPVAATVTAVAAGAHVEVRDGGGALVFEGDLVIGEVKRVTAEPPVTVSSDNGGAVSVVIDGREAGVLGDADVPSTRVFQSR